MTEFNLVSDALNSDNPNIVITDPFLALYDLPFFAHICLFCPSLGSRGSQDGCEGIFLFALFVVGFVFGCFFWLF